MGWIWSKVIVQLLHTRETISKILSNIKVKQLCFNVITALSIPGAQRPTLYPGEEGCGVSNKGGENSPPQTARSGPPTTAQFSLVWNVPPITAQCWDLRQKLIRW